MYWVGPDARADLDPLDGKVWGSKIGQGSGEFCVQHSRVMFDYHDFLKVAVPDRHV